MRANTERTTRGAGDKMGGRGRGKKNSVEQRHEDICGRERRGGDT